MNKFCRSCRAVSPVLTMLLLVGVAVAASVVTFSWVTKLTTSQSQQVQTWVRIDNVVWIVAENKVNLTLRNMGTTSTMIDSISVRENIPGSDWHTDMTEGIAAGALDVGETKTFTWDQSQATPTPDDIKINTSYVIRATTTTGFNEMATSTPETS